MQSVAVVQLNEGDIKCYNPGFPWLLFEFPIKIIFPSTLFVGNLYTFSFSFKSLFESFSTPGLFF